MNYRYCSLILLFSLLFSALSAQNLDRFLNEQAIETGEETINENIRYFLNPRQKKQTNQWYEGEISTREGQTFSDLQLKFNTFSNTVFIRTKGQIYSLSTTALSEFSVKDGGKTRRFVNGFGKLSSYQLNAHMKLAPNGFMSYISAYPYLFELSSKKIELMETGEDRSSLKMDFLVPHKDKAIAFVRFLEEHPESIFAQLQSTVSQFNEKTFYEVLHEGESYFYLKHNQARVSSHDSNALARHNNAISFDDSSFYLSNRHQELKEVKSTRKSIKEGLMFTGAFDETSAPQIKTTRQLEQWLESN